MAAPEELSYVSYNQDSKCLQIGHKAGYQFYPLQHAITDKLEVDCPRDLAEMKIVERLFTSGLVILVNSRQPRSLHVCHLHERKNIYEQMFSSSILSVKLNQERIVVCLEEFIYIYNLRDLKHLHTIKGIPPNKSGLMDLASSVSLIAYPGSTSNGKVNVFHAGTDQLKSDPSKSDPLKTDQPKCDQLKSFVAHESPLACLKLNTDGSLLATASTRGTVIRVFSVSQGTRMYEFRRGVTRSASIYSLSFSFDSSLLVSSSNTETVHIFKLASQSQQESAQQESTVSSWMGYLSSYLPVQMNDLVLMEKSFATATLPISGGKAYAALPYINGTTVLTVATTAGFLYCYRISEDGGACDLIKQHQIGPFHPDTEREVENESLDSPPTSHVV